MAELGAGRVKSELTQEAFRAFLRRLDPDLERAGVEYLSLKARLNSFFRWKGCPDPDKMADEAIDRTAQRIYESEAGNEPPISNFQAFLDGVARNLVREFYHNRHAEVPLDQLPVLKAPEVSDEDERRFDVRIKCMLRCLKRMESEDRHLIEEYDLHEQRIERRKRLAKSMGITVGNLRVKAFHAREKLRKLCQKELGGGDM